MYKLSLNLTLARKGKKSTVLFGKQPPLVVINIGADVCSFVVEQQPPGMAVLCCIF